MPKVKIPRKSTTIDMTAMCDVAFLLLAFFILCAKFKPSDALSVTTPSSVFSKIAPETNVVTVTITPDSRVFLSVSDKNVSEKLAMINDINVSKNLGLSDAEKSNFANRPASYIGAPFSQLKSFLDKTPDELKNMQLPGIPAKDSTNNELIDWIRAATGAFAGSKMALLVRGDNAAKYPAFQSVLIAFKRNDQLKFQMITSPIAAPRGSELEKTQIVTGKKGVE
ncbi:MAG: biopolymer transporter ExbD [Bacteroidota bacterium]|nr:biopolymer transporter ExbD [Bacteroidota bacterium]MDP4216199.1 biopolymer transporter ExbD [Bacteroidota bacterium]MDP4244396.1 biopolymer transporter ExbD [Bacteroidota bacterium]MDP4256129.1 biopolymer transporter ExbD [Bacteroidota bacterium]MDP4259412.1 biopolymer transporter ExbD [Bacteroidota bacterium]